MKQSNKTPWFKKRLVYYLIMVLLTFPLAELSARILGYEAYHTEPYSINSEPKRCLVGDNKLGLKLNPGEFDITINAGTKYHATHTESRMRLTTPVVKHDSNCIYLLGCSFTYGMGVGDNETFASLLQTKNKKYRIHNLGVPGYGTVQSLLQLKSLIETGETPQIVILNFSKLHFDRNVLAPAYRKALKHGYANSNDSDELNKSRFPYYSNETNRITYAHWKNLYANWTGREYFAIVNYLNSNADKHIRSKLDPVKATKELFSKILKVCDQNKIAFKVCFLDEDEDVQKLKSFCEKNKIDHISIGLTHKNPELTNLPYDMHPNAKAHAKIADKIAQWLTKD